MESFYKSFYLWLPEEEDDIIRNPHIPLNIDESETVSPKVDILTPQTKESLKFITDNCVTVDEESKFSSGDTYFLNSTSLEVMVTNNLPGHTFMFKISGTIRYQNIFC